MTPAVVTQLIKQGINPLEMKISDLNRVAEQVRSEVGKDDNQKFSEYLYKLEKIIRSQRKNETPISEFTVSSIRWSRQTVQQSERW